MKNTLAEMNDAFLGINSEEDEARDQNKRF